MRLLKFRIKTISRERRIPRLTAKFRQGKRLSRIRRHKENGSETSWIRITNQYIAKNDIRVIMLMGARCRKRPDAP